MSQLKHLLKTNKELIRVLDEQLAELERVSPEFDETFSEKQAFFYLSTYTQGDTEARIQMDQDAAYVVEKVVVLSTSQPDASLDGFPTPTPPERTFSLVDDYSGRELTISTVGKQPVSSGALPVFAVPIVTTNATIDQVSFSVGQQEWWWQLHDEFILPRGSVLRIRSTTLLGEVRPSDFFFSVALVGYKVFG